MKTLMKNCLLGVMVAGLPIVVAAQQQEISVVYETSRNNTQFAVVKYDVSDGQLTTGLGFRLHYDSNLVEVINIELFQEDSNLGIQIMDDTDDLDGDPSTDRYINAAWVDLSGYWPEVESFPTALYRIEFDTTLPGNKRLFSVSASAAAAGYELVSHTN